MKKYRIYIMAVSVLLISFLIITFSACNDSPSHGITVDELVFEKIENGYDYKIEWYTPESRRISFISYDYNGMPEDFEIVKILDNGDIEIDCCIYTNLDEIEAEYEVEGILSYLNRPYAVVYKGEVRYLIRLNAGLETERVEMSYDEFIKEAIAYEDETGDALSY